VTDQSRSVTGNRPLTTHEIAWSRSLAVTLMMLRAYDHRRAGTRGSPVVTAIVAIRPVLSGMRENGTADGHIRRSGGPARAGRGWFGTAVT
jgi:hypothetical protein